MSDSKKEKITVYWSPWSLPERASSMMLLDIKPVSLMSDIQKRRAKNPIIPPVSDLWAGDYQACSALHTFTKNTFIIKSPITAEVELDQNGVIIENSFYSNWFTERISSIENSFSIDLDLSYLFFSEENLTAEITPPHMHKTIHSQYGFPVVGQMDISSWFRPFPVVFQLWENTRSLKIQEGEPLLYLRFNTDKQVEFKKFFMTESLFHKAKACIDYKQNFRFQPLSKLYSIFNSYGLRGQVLKEIKENIV